MAAIFKCRKCPYRPHPFPPSPAGLRGNSEPTGSPNSVAAQPVASSLSWPLGATSTAGTRKPVAAWTQRGLATSHPTTCGVTLLLLRLDDLAKQPTVRAKPAGKALFLPVGRLWHNGSSHRAGARRVWPRGQ
ncbi:unnamed protein product [Protopolystoma xenopodis]|uniref:Uncharacterized protein n=1 Tax=Protopolystoma xenopodis TaxID=117903 RepID=A0A3S5BQR9_9PLAT|nr:unnamed protein product [Protopolystoma xenopodis]